MKIVNLFKARFIGILLQMMVFGCFGTVQAQGIPGTLKWKLEIGLGQPTSAVVMSDIVYIGTTGGISAVTASTGERIWGYQNFSKGPGLVQSSQELAVANGIVYGTFGPGFSLYAINAYTGEKIWTMPRGSGFILTPVVANGVVYIGSGPLYALNAATGQQIWNDTTADLSCTPPAVDKGVVYFASDSQLRFRSEVSALNAANGEQKWVFEASSDSHGRMPSSPVIVNGVLYVGSYDRLYAVDTTTGNQIWNATVLPSTKFQLEVNVNSPTVTDGI